jgi:hypothetical protein
LRQSLSGSLTTACRRKRTGEAEEGYLSRGRHLCLAGGLAGVAAAEGAGQTSAGARACDSENWDRLDAPLAG